MEDSNKSVDPPKSGWPVGPYSPVDSSAHLPVLTKVAQMDLEARRKALAQWVSWFNGHRSIVGPELEKQLDSALHALDREESSASEKELAQLQHDFDEWIEALPRASDTDAP